jgi:WD40 repeat protein
MELLDVFSGKATWKEYISSSAQTLDQELSIYLESPAHAAAETLVLMLRDQDRHEADESGLGAIGSALSSSLRDSPYEIVLGIEGLAGGIDRLDADFNLSIGDLMWKLEMRLEAQDHALQEIRLPQFELQAAAYRIRAERAYLNGWYEEALEDFVAAAARNYPDFAVHRSIGSICLYHLIDLPRALECFEKAARYSRPVDTHHSAEAHYFAGITSAILGSLDQALSHMEQATTLNPSLHDAFYHRACLGLMQGDQSAAVQCLEQAIKGDPRYYHRAARCSLFDCVQSQVKVLLDQIVKPGEEKLAKVKQEADLLKSYCIADSEEERISKVFQMVEQQVALERAYRAGRGFLAAVDSLQEELTGIQDLFCKQYEVDPRDYVRSIAFNPDGALLATGFLNGGIKLWEVDSGLCFGLLAGHIASVNSVAFSSDGRLLASASRDRTIKLWDVSRGQVLDTLRGHEDEVRAATFSPDGQWLASGGHDKTVRIWRVATGNEVQPLRGHTRQVTSTAFSPDGLLLASGSSDRTVKLWDLAGGRAVRTLAGHNRGVASLAFSPDGRSLASGGEDARIKIWDVATGQEIRALKGLRYGASSVSFSPDGQLLAAGSLGQTIAVWRLDSGVPVKKLRCDDISYNSVAFSPKGQWLALGSRDLQFWLKAALTREQYATVKAGEERALLAKANHDEGWNTSMSPFTFSAEDDWEEQAHRRGLCIICARKLGRIERYVFDYRCKKHR